MGRLTESAAVPPTQRRGVWGWIDERFGVGGLRYPVPRHANSLAYTLGGITLASFVGLVVTWIYLSQGKALHEAGREFRPATGPQEFVGIILGAVLLLLGAFALLRDRTTALRP